MELRDTIPSEIFLGYSQERWIWEREGSRFRRRWRHVVIQDNGINKGPSFICGLWALISKFKRICILNYFFDDTFDQMSKTTGRVQSSVLNYNSSHAVFKETRFLLSRLEDGIL
ncbi:hypothetical protein AVEN_27658-1 [Araneus ventricosus]|uniref:Uncharacterized protein n=1 Tax=Araneus ventricosus TaxID=182803 RepID=A0A4Y2WKD2_ARAVE|nr:hypothetical protein AVEN_27658-1 [Araneus ventricosus]